MIHLEEHFIEAWSDPGCSVELKKQIIRTLIEEIVVNEEPVGTLAVAIRWSGGTHTAFEMQKPSPSTMHRCVPYAPWELQRSDLETPRMRRILETLRQTGRLQLGDPLSEQGALFPLDDSETKER